ncbi:MAG: TRAP transporter large permease subunit [Alphaproteobacteria bacterium]|nr:TRAP transporter large permease subunit [Alphaproteobacteria bacterium]
MPSDFIGSGYRVRSRWTTKAARNRAISSGVLFERPKSERPRRRHDSSYQGRSSAISTSSACSIASLSLRLAVGGAKLTGQAQPCCSSIAVDLYECVEKWFGRLPGGLAITSVAGCAGFGAVTSSSVAAVATIAPMSMPEMRRYRYDPKLATGAIASAGTIAIMITPSVIMVSYGIWTDTSIGHLFIAGIIPGIMLAVMYAGYIWVRCVIDPAMGPVGPQYDWSERFASLVKLLPIIAICSIVLGGIYFGVLTPSEAAGIGVAGVLFVAGLMGRLRWQGLRQALLDSAYTRAMILAVIVAGHIIGAFLVVTHFTDSIIGAITDAGLSKYVVLALFFCMYLVLGAVLDVWGMLILTIPFVFPVM